MSEQYPECNMTSSRASFKGNSFEMNQFPYQSLKRINSAFNKISLLFQTVLESEAKSLLPTVQLDFSWILENVRSTKWSVCKAIWMSDQFPEYQVYQLRTFTQKTFSKWNNVQSKHCRKFHCPLSKISLYYLNVTSYRLTVFRKLFNWTSVGPSKCPIDKLIGLQGHPNVWAVPWVQHDIIQSLFQR